MNTGIYSEADNAELDKSVEAITRAKDTLIQENGAVAINVNNPELFKNIKDIFTSEEAKPKTKTFFSSSKGATTFSIDNTIFSPDAVVCLSGKKFEEKYIKQLESFIFNTKEELDTDKIFSLIYLINIISRDIVPIVILTGRYKAYRNKIISGLNTFFIKNYSTIYSMYTMFNSIGNVPQQSNEPVDHE